MKFLAWILITSLSCQLASSVLTVSCLVRCMYPPKVNAQDFCAQCVETTNLGNAEVCIHSCTNKLYAWIYKNVCDRCAKLAPPSNRLCVYACQNPESYAICDRCMNRILPDHVWCRHACQQKDQSRQFQTICNRCANYPWDSRFYEWLLLHIRVLHVSSHVSVTNKLPTRWLDLSTMYTKHGGVTWNKETWDRKTEHLWMAFVLFFISEISVRGPSQSIRLEDGSHTIVFLCSALWFIVSNAFNIMWARSCKNVS